MTDLILDGGLDIVRARPAVLPGFIRECLNHEVGWRRGYTRIDGFERFDGQISPSTTTGWVFTVADANITGTFTPPETLTWSNDNASGPAGTLLKIEIDGADVRFWLSFRSGQRRPQFGDLLQGDESSASFLMDDINTGEVVTYPEYYGDHGSYLTGLDELAAIARNEVLPVPGGGTIVGLHYHEDQLYAIRDVEQITISAEEANTLTPGMYVVNAAGQIGEVLSVSTDGQTVNIAATVATGFTLASNDTLSIALTIRYNTGSGTFTKGQAAVFGTSGWTGEFGYLDNRDGALSAANGLGVAVYVNPTVNVPLSAGELVTVAPDGLMTVESVMFAYQADVVTVVSASNQSELATMWRSTDAGWEAATSSRQLAFFAGENDPAGPPIADSKVVSGSLAGFDSSGGATSVSWVGNFDDVLAAGGGAIYADPFTDNFGTSHSTDRFFVKGFNAGLLDTDVVTGIEVRVLSDNVITAATSIIYAFPLWGGEGYSAPVPEGGYADAVLGGDGATWGMTPLTPELVNDPDFGFKFVTAAGQTVARTYIDHVEMTVFFTYLPGEKLYLYSPATGTDLGYIRVDSTVVTEGDWLTTDAAGYFRVTDWSTVNIPAGTEIRTAENVTPGVPAGVLVALAEGNLSVPALPGSLQLDENISKYQMISYNFFASEEKNAIYGVSGAGLAFWYDGTTLDFISTGVGVDRDKPRHIAPHENRLALGYIWGEVYLSGPDPLDFSAATGLAASFGFGDKITGLMPAPGKALGVFTESTTNVLIGAPEDFGEQALANVEQRVINHKVGAIEYTVQNIGNAPIFASFRGIETLETMDQYSDFFTAPLTYNVSTWLLERLQTAAGVEAVNKSVVNSVVVRNKNQYRLFFADGYLITLTFVGPEKEPQLTVQQYWFQNDRDKYARCYATASGVTTDGRDRAFFSVEQRPAGPQPVVMAIGENLDYVYELDRGRSFDGHEIEANFSLTYYFSVNEQGGPAPTRSTRYSTVHLHGACAGTASLYLASSANYEELDNPVLPYEEAAFYDNSLPAQDQPLAKYAKGRMTERGFAVSLHVTHKSKLEFPYTIQMLSFVGEYPLKEDY